MGWRIVVATITCNMHTYSHLCGESISDNISADDVSVLLVNDTSVKSWNDISSMYDHVIISGHMLGTASARNLICKYALEHNLGDIILWIDDDIEVCPQFAEPFRKAFDEPDVVIAGYDAVFIKEDFTDQWYVDPFVSDFDYFDSPYAIRLSFLSQYGLYDENFITVGDNTGLCLRAAKLGFQLKPIKNPGIKHYRHKTIGNLENRTKGWEIAVKRLQSLFPPGWRKAYGLEKKVTINPDLQFPIERGRIGGPESIIGGKHE